MLTFSAKDDREAYEYLKKYRKVANKAYVYYYGDNEKSILDSIIDDHPRSFLMKVWEEIVFFIDTKIWDRVKNFYWWLCDVGFWFKTGHNRNESWSLDHHVLRDLVFNIEMLKKNKHGIAQPFIDQAIKLRHKDDKNFNFDAYLARTNYCGNKADEDLAVKLMDEEFDRQLLNIRLYNYYTSYGIISEQDDDYEEMRKIEAKYRKTIPYRPGRFRELDYKKLEPLIEKQWNRINDWNRKWLRMCWD
jgi:hypothetical protein